MRHEEYFARPMVEQIAAIFSYPQPPPRVTEVQFDLEQDHLIEMAKSSWDQIEWFGTYIYDLAYVNLQQNLFDYLFPALLIRWRDELNGDLPAMAYPCFYSAIRSGKVFTKMMSPSRAELVYQWMADGYLNAVETRRFSVSPNERLLGKPLAWFHALGQSVPITKRLLQELLHVDSLAKAQWWLVLGTGIGWNANQCPFIPSWTPVQGGGGVYLLSSDATTDHGYLDENADAMEEMLSLETIRDCLYICEDIFPLSPEYTWLRSLQTRLSTDPVLYEVRVHNFLSLIRKPNLGGVQSQKDHFGL